MENYLREFMELMERAFEELSESEYKKLQKRIKIEVSGLE